MNNLLSRIKPRILFIVPSLARAGAEIQVVNLVNGLVDDNALDVHLLCFEKNLALLDKLNRDKVGFHHIPRRRAYDLSLTRGIAKLIDELQIDLVHCTLQIALLMGWLATKSSGRKPPLILALHTTINCNRKMEAFDWLLYQWLMRDCRHIICVCANQQRHWHDKFPFLKQLTTVIYNGIDTDYFSPANAQSAAEPLRLQLAIPSDDQIICHVAAFRPEKGHLLLLEAFEALLTTRPGVTLVFAGEGALQPQVEAMVSQKKLRERVRFLGAVADVRPVLAMADLAVLPSTAVETFSLAMLEAMSMQTPLVATALGGAAEAVIPGATGFLAPPGDAEALASALVDALSDGRRLRKLGEQAREYVAEHFTQAAMIRKTQALLIESTTSH